MTTTTAENDERLRELVHVLIAALVDNEAAVNINIVSGQESALIEIRVDTKDIGKVVGKEGRHLSALRMLMQAASRKVNRNVRLELLDADQTTRRPVLKNVKNEYAKRVANFWDE